MDTFYHVLSKFKGNLILLTIILSFGFIFYACSESQNPVSDSILTESFSVPEASAIGVNDTEPVTIQDFTITFNGNSYDSEANTSTFSYTVTRTSNASGFNYMAFEIPACAADHFAGYTPSESSSVTENEIRWASSIGNGSSRIHTVAYNGKQPTGMVDASIQSSGSGDLETKLIPGPCKGIYSISGFVYVDEDGNGTRESREGGIENVTVQLVVNDDVAMKTTSANGSFSFDVYSGGSPTDFTLSVPMETDDPNDFNEFLYDTYSATEGEDGITGSISDTDVMGNHFGFKPETGKIAKDFEDEVIELRTEKPKFWEDEIKFADKGRKTLFTKTELLGFLNKIDALDLTYKFDFGTAEKDRLDSAEKILSVKRNSTELEKFLSELLAAKLNVVSGNGAVDENGDPLNDFNTLILKTGAAAAVTLTGDNNALLMSNATFETTTFTTTSSLSSSDNLLTSFNGSGGGIGTR